MTHASRWAEPVLLFAFAACGSRGPLPDGAAGGNGGAAVATGGAGARASGGFDGGSGGASCGQADGGGEDARCPAGQICVGHVYIADNGSKSGLPSVCKSDLCGDQAVSCGCDAPLCADWGAIGDCSVSEGVLTCTTFGICASSETPIATPDGPRAIAELRPGDLVYSVDGAALRPVPILRIARTRVHNHRLVEVRTTDGAVLEMSAGHPTADGRTFGELRVGDRLDGAAIVSRRVIPYAHPFTYDIEPASNTRTYVASGRLVGSTLPPSGGGAVEAP